jgi:hypothetical protein
MAEIIPFPHKRPTEAERQAAQRAGLALNALITKAMQKACEPIEARADLASWFNAPPLWPDRD